MPQALAEGYGRAGDLDDVLSKSTRTASIPGMSSLDVKFAPRGRVYRFTTPRGNAPITARAIATPTFIRFQSLAWVIGMAILALLVGRWLRRGGLTALRGRRGGTILMVLGHACLLTSILPWAGLLAILIGACFFFVSQKIASTS